MRHCINKKLQTFHKLELPLLINAGYTSPTGISARTNAVSAGTNVLPRSPAAAGCGVANQTTMREERGEWDSNPRVLSDMGLAIGTLEKYLVENKRRNVKQVLSYAHRYGLVLVNGDAGEIAALNDNKRRHVMEALALLSKCAGLYQKWKQVKEQYQLKWGSGNTDAFYVEYIENMISGEQQLPEMLQWLRETCTRLPPVYANMLAFTTMSGLRPTEAYECLRLLASEDRSKYVTNKDRWFIIEHYKHPATFFRKTKKCFITIATPQVMELADRCEPVSWEALRSAINKRGMKTHAKWCRKINGTILRQSGLDAEVIDVLHGRVPRSVFQRFYLRGGLDFDKICKATDGLYKVVAPLIKKN